MSCARFKRTIGISNRTAGVIMAMKLNVTMNDAAQGAHQIIHLAWIGNPYRVGNPHPVDANFIDSAVNAQQINEVTAKAVFAAEAHF